MSAAAVTQLPAASSSISSNTSGWPSPGTVRAAAARIEATSTPSDSRASSPKTRSAFTPTHTRGMRDGLSARSAGSDPQIASPHISTPMFPRRPLPQTRQPASGSTANSEPLSASAPNSSNLASATELCQQIRWLREGSALVSTCDAVLTAKVERIQRLQASRRMRVAEAGWQHNWSRLKQAQVWFATKSWLRTSSLLMACVIYAWAEDALRPRVLWRYVHESGTQCLCLLIMHLWRRGTGQARYDAVVEQIEDEMNSARMQANGHLEKLQARFELMQQRHAQHIFVNFRRMSRLVFWTRSRILAVWSDLVELSKANRHVKAQAAVQSHVFVRVFAVYLRSVSFQAWCRLLRARQQADRNNDIMDKAIFLLRGVIWRDLKRLTLQGWRQVKYQTEREKMTSDIQTRLEVESLDKTIEAKARAKAIRTRHATEAFRLFGQITATGLLHSFFKTWKMEAGKEKAEHRVVWLGGQIKDLEEWRCVTEANATIRLVWLLALTFDARLQLYFTSWCRLPVLDESQKLKGALYRKQELISECQSCQELTLQHQALTAASSMAQLLERKVQKVQHAALERMNYSAQLYRAESVREDAVRQRALAIEERAAGIEMHAQAKRRRRSAKSMTTRLLAQWYENYCRSVLQLWSALAAGHYNHRLMEEKSREVESIRAAHQEKWRGHRLQRKNNFWVPISDLSITLSCMVVWRCWEQAVFQAQAAVEREAETSRLQHEEEDLNHWMIEKKNLVQAPLMQWVLQHLGVETPNAVDPSLVKSVLREWHQATLMASRLHRGRLQKQVIHGVVLDLATEVGAQLDDTLLMRVLGVWWLLSRVVITARDKVQADRARGIRVAKQRRLQRYVSASVKFFEHCEAIDFMLMVFSSWRRHAGITVVERTGNQVCLELDERSAAGRRVVVAEKDRISSALEASFRMTKGDHYLSELIAALCFPAWRRVARAARLKRAVLTGEEQALAELENLHKRSSVRCRQWSYWGATSKTRVAMQDGVTEVFFSWHKATRGAIESRRKSAMHTRVTVGVEKALSMTGLNTVQFTNVSSRSRETCWRSFSAWKQAAQDVQRLESLAHELEGQLMRVAGADGANLLLEEMDDTSSEGSHSDSSMSSQGSMWSESGAASPASGAASPSRASRASRQSRNSRRRMNALAASPATPQVAPETFAGGGTRPAGTTGAWPWAANETATEDVNAFSGLSSSSAGPSADAPTTEPNDTPAISLEAPLSAFAALPGQKARAGASSANGSEQVSAIGGNQQQLSGRLSSAQLLTSEFDSARRRSSASEFDPARRRSSALSAITPQEAGPALTDRANTASFLVAQQAKQGSSLPSLALSAVPQIAPKDSSEGSGSAVRTSPGEGLQSGPRVTLQAAPQARPQPTPPGSDRSSKPITVYPQDRQQGRSSISAFPGAAGSPPQIVTGSRPGGGVPQARSSMSMPAGMTGSPPPKAMGSPPGGGVPDFAARLSQFTFGMNSGSSR